MVRFTSMLLASALLTAPLAAQGADLTVYWLKGFYPEEDTALQALVKRYEQKSGKTVQLTLSSQADHSKVVAAARQAGTPPDVAQGNFLDLDKLAYDDALTDLSDVIGPVKDQFVPVALDAASFESGRTGRRSYYMLPMLQFAINLHAWKSLLEQAGIATTDIPKEWDAFWAFWCDKVQPAVRKATGRDDIYGIGLPMSVANDTLDTLEQFQHAYRADYLTPDGKLLLDDASIRQKLIKSLAEYVAIFKKGCTPPDAVDWDNSGNNKAFLTQKVVMTPNTTLSIPNALKAERPDDYYKRSLSLLWPQAADGRSYPLQRGVYGAVVFKDAKHVDQAKDFLRFILQGGELETYLEAGLGRGFPTLVALVNTPFWQDPADPHRATAAKLLAQWPAAPFYDVINYRFGKVYEEKLWEQAVHRVAAEGVAPEQAVDDTIARIKQIMSE